MHRICRTLCVRSLFSSSLLFVVVVGGGGVVSLVDLGLESFIYLLYIEKIFVYMHVYM